MDIGIENLILDVDHIRRLSNSTMVEMVVSEKKAIDILTNPSDYIENKRFSYVIITPENKGYTLMSFKKYKLIWKYFRYKGIIYPI